MEDLIFKNTKKLTAPADAFKKRFLFKKKKFLLFFQLLYFNELTVFKILAWNRPITRTYCSLLFQICADYRGLEQPMASQVETAAASHRQSLQIQ